MKKLVRNLIALTLSAALCVSGAAVALAQPQEQNTKDETVYVLADSNGSTRKIIVSDWLKNTAGADTLLDESGLTGVQNVKGSESCTDNGGTLTWSAAGSDIYYQGTTDKELPVTLTVSYQLDGEGIAPEDLVGKSGHVTIRYDYKNNQYEVKEITGTSQKIYVPFAAVTGLVLDNNRFRNVTVTNGKAINDGDRTAVLGLALPGMQENLGLEPDTLDVPDYVEISADVTDFRMSMTLTLVTNQVFQALEDAPIASSDDLNDIINKVAEGLTRLTDGSNALYEGLDTLLEKSGELAEGVNQLAQGAQTLQDGTASLEEGAGQLKEGIASLNDGLNTLAANNYALNGGAEQVFNTLLATATTQLKAAGVEVPDLTIENYGDVLSQVMDSLSESGVHQKAVEQVNRAVNANRSDIILGVTAAVREQVAPKITQAVRAQVTAQVTQAVQAQVTAQVIAAATGLSPDAYQAAVDAGQVSEDQQAAVSAAVQAQMNSDTVQATISANTDAQMQSEAVQATISANTDAQMNTEDVQAIIDQNVSQKVASLVAQNMQSEAVQSQLAAAAEGLKTIRTLKDSLDSYNAFYVGLQTYTGGVSTAADGSAQLLTGSDSLYAGAGALNQGAAALTDGVNTLADSIPALTDGVTQLRDGAKELSDGIREFADQGIRKIADLVDGDVESLVARITATAEVSKNYRIFTAVSDDMDSQVKFLYRTDEVN